MGKMRVYELARDLGIETKILLSTLKTVGIQVASHQSTISDEQAELVRKAIRGEAPEVVAPSKPKTVKRSAGATTVIRRRRRVVKEETSTEETEPTQTTEPKVEVVEVEIGSSATAKDEGLAQQPQESQTASKEQSMQGAVESEEEKPPVKKKKRSVGATIVRRASPEEIEKGQAEERARKRHSREDSRGTKYTRFSQGGGRSTTSSSEETGYDADKIAEQQAAASIAEQGTRGKKLRDKKRLEEEEELERARRVTQKQRRSQINRHILLSQLSDMDDDLDDDLDQESSPAPVRQKTVYTPGATQRRRDLKRRKDLKKTEITVARSAYRVVRMGHEITVADLAKQLKVKGAELVKKLMDQGMMVTVNQSIDFDTAALIASDYNYEVKSTIQNIEDILGRESEEKLAKATEIRPPIVTVMGHVDHGKTSILDAIRQSDVATREAGGITQHIGAYSVTHNGKKIAFLDTPGHEAFSAMRARGADITDIVVLVVAADDGVMPQTIEAINHARAAQVPLVIAVNKIDKPNINLDRIYSELAEHGVQAEEWGGETQFVKCSAITKEGLDDLLEAVLLQAEILELKTVSDIPAQGVVVEAHLDTGRGAVATVMVKHGTLKVGDELVAGTTFGRVRAMYDHTGRSVTEAGPSTPVEVLGLSEVPSAGDPVHVVADEKKAKEVVEWRKENQERSQQKSTAQSLEDLLSKMKDSEIPELPLIIKADTQGSLEAVCEALGKLNTDKVKNKIIHSAVGGVSESDLTLASASGAVIIGFNVRAARGLDDVAEKQGIPLRYFSVIYDLVDSVKQLMAGKLPPVREEVVIGRAEVRQLINVPKVGTIAGSAVIDGKITRNSHLRLVRDDIVIYDGKIGSLRRFKDDVKEVKSGYECGIAIENYNDIKPGDVIEAYEIHETQQEL